MSEVAECGHGVPGCADATLHMVTPGDKLCGKCCNDTVMASGDNAPSFNSIPFCMIKMKARGMIVLKPDGQPVTDWDSGSEKVQHFHAIG
jgi:hypothetical protein